MPLDLWKRVEEPGSRFSGEAGVIIRQPRHQAETVPAHGAIMIDLMSTAQHTYNTFFAEHWPGKCIEAAFANLAVLYKIRWYNWPCRNLWLFCYYAPLSQMGNAYPVLHYNGTRIIKRPHFLLSLESVDLPSWLKRKYFIAFSRKYEISFTLTEFLKFSFPGKVVIFSDFFAKFSFRANFRENRLALFCFANICPKSYGFLIFSQQWSLFSQNIFA
jgi:hypothetical protein